MGHNRFEAGERQEAMSSMHREQGSGAHFSVRDGSRTGYCRKISG